MAHNLLAIDEQPVKAAFSLAPIEEKTHMEEDRSSFLDPKVAQSLVSCAQICKSKCEDVLQRYPRQPQIVQFQKQCEERIREFQVLFSQNPSQVSVFSFPVPTSPLRRFNQNIKILAAKTCRVARQCWMKMYPYLFLGGAFLVNMYTTKGISWVFGENCDWVGRVGRVAVAAVGAGIGALVSQSFGVASGISASTGVSASGMLFIQNLVAQRDKSRRIEEDFKNGLLVNMKSKVGTFLKKVFVGAAVEEASGYVLRQFLQKRFSWLVVST